MASKYLELGRRGLHLRGAALRTLEKTAIELAPSTAAR